MYNLKFIFTWSILLSTNFCNSASSNPKKNNVQSNQTMFNAERNVKRQCIFIRENISPSNDSLTLRNTFYQLEITGSTILFSDIPPSNFCQGNIEVIKMIATEKIIIDQNYSSKGNYVILYNAAPILIVNGRRRINLRGHNGVNQKRAADGKTDGNINGTDGQDGFPGGPGGEFYGFYGEWRNEKNLMMNVNGGNGGAGQDGGNGANGTDGTVFEPDPKLIKDNGDVDGFNIKWRKESYSPMFSGMIISELVEGKLGTNGGDGGNGGRGGAGGTGGIVSLSIVQRQNCKVAVRSRIFGHGKNGQSGKPGNGGKGGNAGQTGWDVQMDLYGYKGVPLYITNLKDYGHLPNFEGHDGSDGAGVTTSNRNFNHTSNHYRKYFKEYAHYSEQKKTCNS